MERPQYLIDTNAVIDYFGQHMPAKGLEFMDAVFDQIPNVSVVTKIEVLVFTMPDEHYQLLINFMNDTIIFDLNKDVVDASIGVRKRHKLNYYEQDVYRFGLSRLKVCSGA